MTLHLQCPYLHVEGQDLARSVLHFAQRLPATGPGRRCAGGGGRGVSKGEWGACEEGCWHEAVTGRVAVVTSVASGIARVSRSPGPWLA